MKLRPSDQAWIALGVGVLTYDVCCEEGDTMSEAVDRWLLRHPWFVRGVAVAVCSHLCNFVPGRFDVIHLGFLAMRKLRRL